MDERPYDYQASYTSARCYVLKLHRDVKATRDSVRGRLEHIPSGAHVEFDSWDNMLSWIARHAAGSAPAA